MRKNLDIKMTGYSGYLGRVIRKELKKNGHRVGRINREVLYGPPEKLSEELRNIHVLVNLAGAPVLQRWTDKNKKEIYNSRALTVQNMVRAIQLLPEKQRPQKIISASAIGLYTPGILHSEESREFDTGFLGEVVRDWEKAWEQLPGEIRLTIFRISLVLGPESAIIKKLFIPFKLGVGGKIGNGKQPFPFIHESDAARAFLWATETPETEGIYNLAAPQQITNEAFTRSMAKILHRPACLTVPALALKMVYGKAAKMLTESPAVMPYKLIEKGFTFRYLTIDETLKNILK